jgi:ABC-2 type transport system permease protein
MRSGVGGALVLVSVSALWGVAYAGIGMLVALHTRNVQATSASFLVFFPLLFLTPNFVPFSRLTPVMEVLARGNPVSYVIEGLRSLVLEGWVLDKLAICLGIIAATGLILTWLSVRAIEGYDR